MENSDHKNEDENCSTPVEEEQDQGLLCKLQKVNIIKVESCDDDDDDHHQEQDQVAMMDGDDDDGFKTPTKTEQRLTVDLTCPPPAPMKPKSRLMKRRRPTRRPLFQVSPQDFELIFAPRSALPKDNHHGDNSNNTHLDISVDSSGNIKKVNHPNLPTLMSFR